MLTHSPYSLTSLDLELTGSDLGEVVSYSVSPGDLNFFLESQLVVISGTDLPDQPVLVHEGDPLTGSISGGAWADEYRGGLGGVSPYGMDALQVVDLRGDAKVVARMQDGSNPYYAAAVRGSSFEFGDGWVEFDARTYGGYYPEAISRSHLRYGDGDSRTTVVVQGPAVYAAKGIVNSTLDFGGGVDEVDVRVVWETSSWGLWGVQGSHLDFGDGSDLLRVELVNGSSSLQSWALSGSTVLMGNGDDEIRVIGVNGVENATIDGGLGNDVLRVEVEQRGLRNVDLRMGGGSDLVVLEESGVGALSVEGVRVDLGEGDDRIELSRGTATVVGGSGQDTLVVTGLRSDYNVVVHTDRVQLNARDDVFTAIELQGIESIQFADGQQSIALLPSYVLESNVARLIEGQVVEFKLTSSQLPAGTSFNYTLSGVEQSDLVGQALGGSISLDASGHAILAVQLAEDGLAESAEMLTLTVESQGFGNQEVGVLVFDADQPVLVHEGDPLTGSISGGAWADEYRGGLGGVSPYGMDALQVVDLRGDAKVVARMQDGSNPYYAAAVRGSSFEFGDGWVEFDARTYGGYYPEAISRSHLRYGDGDSRTTVVVQGPAVYAAKGIVNSTLDFGGGVDEVDVRVVWETSSWGLWGVQGSHLDFGDGSDLLRVELVNGSSSLQSWALSGSTVLMGNGDDEIRVIGVNGVENATIDGGLGNDVLRVEVEQRGLRNVDLRMGGGSDLVVLEESGVGALSVEGVRVDLGEGDDRIELSRGTATVVGGSGQDTLVVTGLRSDYNVVVHTDRVQLNARDDVFTAIELQGIESIQFADGQQSIALLPSYVLESNVARLIEGQVVEFKLTSSQLPAGTSFNYTLSGVEQSDLVGQALGGSISLDASGHAILAVQLAEDGLAESAEMLTLTVESQGFGNQEVGVLVFDADQPVLVHEGDPLTGSISGGAWADEYRGGLGGVSPYGMDALQVVDLRGDAKVVARMQDGSNPYYAAAVRGSSFEFGDGWVEFDARTYGGYYPEAISRSHLRYGDGDSRTTVVVQGPAVYAAKGIVNSTLDFGGGVDEVDVRVVWETSSWGLWGVQGSHLDFGDGSDLLRVELVNGSSSLQSWALSGSTVLMGNGDDEIRVIGVNGVENATIDGGLGNDVLRVEVEQRGLRNVDLRMGGGSDLVVLEESGVGALSVEGVRVDLGEGDDRIELSRGTATVVGGSGQDTLVVTGLRSDYNVVVHTDRVQLNARDDVFTAIELQGVESIQFADGQFDTLTFTKSLSGHVYHWKSHALVDNVALSVRSVGQAQTVDPLFEFKNGSYLDSGDFSMEVWVNLGEAETEFLDLDLAFLGDPNVSIQLNNELKGWTFAHNQQSTLDARTFMLSGISSTPADALTGSVKLGELLIELQETSVMQEVRFLSGSVAENSLSAYSVSFASYQPLTDSLGEFELQVADLGVYQIEGSRVLTSLEAGNVISSSDALSALKMAVGRNPNADGSTVSPYQYLAADINNSGSVTSADALGILKMAVRHADAPAREWIFVDEKFDFWDEGLQAFTTKRTNVPKEDAFDVLVDTSNDTDINLVAILKGDVNGSWSAPSGSETLDRDYFVALASQNPNAIQLEQFGFSII